MYNFEKAVALLREAVTIDTTSASKIELANLYKQLA